MMSFVYFFTRSYKYCHCSEECSDGRVTFTSNGWSSSNPVKGNTILLSAFVGTSHLSFSSSLEMVFSKIVVKRIVKDLKSQAELITIFQTAKWHFFAICRSDEMITSKNWVNVLTVSGKILLLLVGSVSGKILLLLAGSVSGKILLLLVGSVSGKILLLLVGSVSDKIQSVVKFFYF